MIAPRSTAAGLLLVLAALAVAAPPGLAAQERERAERELGQIRSEIERVQADLQRGVAERDRAAQELRSAEQAAADSRRELQRLQRERAERGARRAALARERLERQEALATERSALAAQMRTAYMVGREEPLKLLLNQRDPARAGRMFAYYSYFGRARAEQIARIEEHVARIGELDTALAAEETQLLELEQRQRGELDHLEQARTARGQVLAGLAAETRSRSASLERLRRQQAALEKLLRDLQRAIERFPGDATTAFGKLRGRLAWPVAGRLAARFGETRAGGLKWDGVLVAAERGAPVRAVHRGRVVYADWLAGLGLLVIVDHGEGYLSLYAHNDQIYKRVGEPVAAGETVAAVGDSGGRSRPELYFEIRRKGKPVDPRGWFRSRDP
ncbi:MAG: peptidoglycan DD-metalloendopeptidase family protein [Steroidobacteraceae bacterium]